MVDVEVDIEVDVEVGVEVDVEYFFLPVHGSVHTATQSSEWWMLRSILRWMLR